MRLDLLRGMPPFLGGGSDDPEGQEGAITWADLPAKFEGGTPAIGEAVGFAAAVRWIDELGLPAIHAAEADLATYALERVAEVPGLTVFGPPAGEGRGLVSFDMEGVHAHDISEILDRHGVAVRAGHHCAQVLMERLGVPRPPAPASPSTTRAPRSIAWSRACSMPERSSVCCDGRALRDQILEHYKRPHHFGRWRLRPRIRGQQPVLRRRAAPRSELDDEGRVSEVAFEGQGCAISTAATSLLTDELEGMTREESSSCPRTSSSTCSASTSPPRG